MTDGTQRNDLFEMNISQDNSQSTTSSHTSDNAVSANQAAQKQVETQNETVEKKSKSKGRPRSEKSQKAILKATNALLLHQSVQDLSIEAIAKKAKVGKTTIYRWWPNKTAIVMEALMSQPGLSAPMATPRNNSEAITMQLEKLIRLLHSKNGETIAQLFSEAQNDEKSLEIFESSFLSPLIDAIEFSIQEGRNTGEFRTNIDIKTCVDILCGPIFFRLMSRPAELNEKFQRSYPDLALQILKA